MFKQLLLKTQNALSEIVHKDNIDWLNSLCKSYPQKPSLNHPILLKYQEIENLILLAINEKIMIPINKNHKTPLLNIFIGMGTSIDNFDNSDPYLGKKDPRFVDCIIKHAKRAVSLKNTDKKVAIFGGSMNPPTENHMTVIKHLIDTGFFVEIIPNNASPLKNPIEYAPPSCRLQMLNLALNARIDIKHDSYHVSSLEIDRPYPSRMLMSLCALILLSESKTTFTLILTLDDNFINFDSWYKWDEFSSLCKIKFYLRQGVTSKIPTKILNQSLDKLLQTNLDLTLAVGSIDDVKFIQKEILNQITVEVENLPTDEGSASKIREQFKQGPPDKCPNGLAEIVYKYILKHNLYQP